MNISTTQTRKIAITLLGGAALLAVAAASAPSPYYDNPYSPGGALADKHTGPLVLATLTEQSLPTIFPVGTPKEKVVQLLGAPQTNMQQSNGVTSQVFTHSFTSYSRHLIDTQVLTVEYDAAGKVTKTSLTTSQSTW